MKIEGGVKSVGTAVAGKQPATTEPARRQPEAIAATRVDISSLSARLQIIGPGLGEDGSLDAARIAEIKAAISDGRFSVNPERIADGLLQSVREMLKHGR